MTRRRELQRIEPHLHKTYDPRDNMMIRLAFLLFSKREDGITTTMAQEYFKTNNWTTSYDKVKEALEEMIRVNWVSTKQNPYKSNATVYIITTLGEHAVSTTNKLLQENNPLTSLKAFKNLIDGL